MDLTLLIDLMILLGAALMVINITHYIHFTRTMRWMRTDSKNTAILFTPLFLLIAFLIGYVIVALFGDPDQVTAGILFGGSIFVFIIFRIIDYFIERVQENDRIQAELHEARMASKAKTDFLSNMSHDIRTPMNAVLGYTQLARQEGQDEAQIRDYLEKINNAGQHLLTIIDDVLEMGRIESGKMELVREKTQITHILRNARDLFSSQMEEKGITFTVSADNVTDSTVLCDAGRLDRVILNLLSNAYKFTPEGGHIRATLEQTGREGDTGSYLLTVADDGIGMSPEFADRVFDAFEREQTSTVSGIQGTGLGMSITKNIMDLMGGTIEVITVPGEGTTFNLRFDLPIIDEEGQEDSLSEDMPLSDDEALFRGRRILLAEDNPINREIASLLLLQHGFELTTCENGREAVDLLSAASPGEYDIVLMDIQMPVMDGYEATRAIRAMEDPAISSIPVVAMTANAFAEDLEHEKNAGMTAHVSKPLEIRDMFSTLARLLK